MPLLLACRDRNRRRSAAFCDDTRNTRCPRAEKNTAIGSHAGPVGSITTSSRVPAGQSASATVSTAVRLSAVGQALRLATTLPSPSSTRTVWAVALPRSMPTSLLWFIPPPRVAYRHAPARPLGAAPSGHGPKQPRPAAAPTHVLQPGQASKGRPTSL